MAVVVAVVAERAALGAAAAKVRVVARAVTVQAVELAPVAEASVAGVVVLGAVISVEGLVVCAAEARFAMAKVEVAVRVAREHAHSYAYPRSRSVSADQARQLCRLGSSRPAVPIRQDPAR